MIFSRLDIVNVFVMMLALVGIGVLVKMAFYEEDETKKMSTEMFVGILVGVVLFTLLAAGTLKKTQLSSAGSDRNNLPVASSRFGGLRELFASFQALPKRMQQQFMAGKAGNGNNGGAGKSGNGNRAATT